MEARIPALQAEESLRHISEVAVGSGMLKQADARRILEDLHRTASSDTETRRLVTREQRALVCRQMGIDIQVEKK